jgi:hypothetical protein
MKTLKINLELIFKIVSLSFIAFCLIAYLVNLDFELLNRSF